MLTESFEGLKALMNIIYNYLPNTTNVFILNKFNYINDRSLLKQKYK